MERPRPSKASFEVLDLLGEPDSPGDGVGREFGISRGFDGEVLRASALDGSKASPNPLPKEVEKLLSKPLDISNLSSVSFSFAASFPPRLHASPPPPVFKLTEVPPPILAKPDL